MIGRTATISTSDAIDTVIPRGTIGTTSKVIPRGTIVISRKVSQAGRLDDCDLPAELVGQRSEWLAVRPVDLHHLRRGIWQVQDRIEYRLRSRCRILATIDAAIQAIGSSRMMAAIQAESDRYDAAMQHGIQHHDGSRTDQATNSSLRFAMPGQAARHAGHQPDHQSQPIAASRQDHS